MGNLIRSLCLIPVLLIACGKNLPTELEKGIPIGGNKPTGEKSFLFGNFTTTGSQVIVLNEQLAKPVILIFSQDTCLICRAETKMLVQKFLGQRGIPQNVALYTILVGTILEDALDFKADLEIPWDVGFQPGDEFFKSYCPALKVPCVIVETPANGFVYQKTGEFQVEELEKYTGAWTY